MNDRVEWYHRQVWQFDASRAFLEARGLDHSTVRRFRLGYVGVPADGERPRIHGNPVQGCLTIPYEDGRNCVRQVRLRPLYHTDQKYLTVPGEKSHPFAVRAADHPVAIITEGEIDAMILWQLGYRAVGIPGANNWRHEWRWLFRNCDRVILAMDVDPSGMRAAQAIYAGLSLITDVEGWRAPPGHDVNDVFLRYGPQALRDAIGV